MQIFVVTLFVVTVYAFNRSVGKILLITLFIAVSALQTWKSYKDKLMVMYTVNENLTKVF